jgi:hypothetical protein
VSFTGPSDFIAAMAQSRFDSVIGESETVWLEFKTQPYLPWNDEAKRLEFAKDASAMANGGGGLIVFGYKTESEVLTARDIVKAWTPVATTLVDMDGYKQALERVAVGLMVSSSCRDEGVLRGSAGAGDPGGGGGAATGGSGGTVRSVGADDRAVAAAEA